MAVRFARIRFTILSRLRNATVILAILLTLMGTLSCLSGCETVSHERSEPEEVECLSVLGVGICLEYNQPVSATPQTEMSPLPSATP